MAATVAAPAPRVQYENRATEFGHVVLAFAAQLPPPAPAPAPAPGSADDDEQPAAPPAGPERRPTPEFKWIHVANEGTYRGHHQGEFTLSRDSFEQMVRNLRADPKYGDAAFSVGPVTLDGKPWPGNTSRIVQFDYEHASEMAPFEGSIPAQGAPAIGWVLDLDVRRGADGRAQLWALGKLGQQIRRQIDADEYNSVSIAWNPEGVHPVSGQPIGAVLTSIAFTNHPFIRDLLPLAAANRAAGLTSTGSVQITGQSAEAHAGAPSNPTGNTMTAPASNSDLRPHLCRLYHLTPEASDGAVIRAAENAATSASDLAGLLKALGMNTAAEAIGALPDLMGARSKLTELLAQFDALMRADAAVDAEVEMQDVAAAFSSRRFTDGSLVHSLAAHRSHLVQTEIAKLPKEQQGDIAKVRAARSAGRLAFLSHYGVPTNPAHQHLTQTFAAGPGLHGAPTTQYAPPSPLPAPLPPAGYGVQHPFAAAPQGYPQPLQLSQHPPAPPQGAVDLSAFEGNMTQRIMSYLSSQDPAFGKLDIGDRISRASAWRRQNQHLIVGVAA